MRPTLAAAAFALCLAPAAQAARYDVAVDGAVVDLTGFIEIDATGNFSLDAFDAALSAFEITASANGADPFTFTEADATFASGAPGAAASISVAVGGGDRPDQRQRGNPAGGQRPVPLVGFPRRRSRKRRPRPNLIYTTVYARYLSGTSGVYEDDFGPSPFVLATVAPVPAPPAFALLASALLAGGAALRRRSERVGPGGPPRGNRPPGAIR
jgi:hypothetical protein